MAGAIYALNTNVQVTNCSFTNNSALTSSGGALYLDCGSATLYKCAYNISSTNFTQNSAELDGGAIKYTYYQPTISSDSNFVNNTALYGSDIASYAIEMQLSAASTRRMLLSQLTPAAVANLGMNTTLNLSSAVVFVLDHVLVSGSVLSQNLTLTLLDLTGHQVVTDDSSTATMSSPSNGV